MIIKLLEIRDVGTTIPAMAIKLTARDEAEQWLLRRAGYALEAIVPNNPQVTPYTILWPLVGGIATYDAYGHKTNARTYCVAHLFIAEHFDHLQSGAVIDVEYILGERAEPKISERIDVATP